MEGGSRVVQHALAALALTVALNMLSPGQWSSPICLADEPNAVAKLHAELGLPAGEQLPDFSACGFAASERPMPMVPACIGVRPAGDDDTARIQAALDYAASLPLSAEGFRGAVQLAPASFSVRGSLTISSSGVVLRGSTSGSMRTEIVATGHSRRPLVIVGQAIPTRDSQSSDQSDRKSLIVEAVTCGSSRITVDNAAQFTAGQLVKITHPSTKEWIASLGMNRFPSDDGRGSWLDWKPGAHDWFATRRVIAAEGNQLILDVPLTCAIDPQLSRAFVQTIEESSYRNLGVENLDLVSEVSSDNPKDEEHAWDAVRFVNVTDGWARNLDCRHFSGSAVRIDRNSRRITVQDCTSREPVSEFANGRRSAFTTEGQQSLFLRCRSIDARHDFSVGHLVSGPNAFVHCTGKQAHSWSGPTGSWSTGVLFDNVEIDGGGLSLTNRETAAQGTGWSAANCVLWNCVAPVLICRRPPGANNYAIGVWGEVVGDGVWKHLNEFTDPDSLFETQLSVRIGKDVARTIGTAKDHRDFPEWHAELSGKANLTAIKPEPSQRESSAPLTLKNGWLTFGDKLAIGDRLTLSWWRGSVLPGAAREFGPGLTRFVPGQDGLGYTDVIEQVADQMRDSHQVAIEHHWGLWYDRRRDDHQMIRRIGGDVWPPFYELPWARSGKGIAWDGLSQYDLTRFNPWYFDRLDQFAQAADQRQLILMQYMYFQHNILEAGAHWADFPWRPANCIQPTGFPEPPVYVNRKRVFMADQFYDVSQPLRKALHEKYIRHCLDTLGQHSNVIFVLGEEFTGPESFVRFWLDTVSAWEQEHGRQVLTMLSATRDVQQAILANPQYAAHVDIIDIKYWWYNKDGSLYDPPGGQNLAPRQQLREWKGAKARSPQSTAQAIYETRCQHPQKAVVCSLPGTDPWLAVASGASLVALPRSTDQQLLASVPQLLPSSNNVADNRVVDSRVTDSPDADRSQCALVNSKGQSVLIVSSDARATHKEGSVRSIDRSSGKAASKAASSSASTEGGYRISWFADF